MTRMDDRLKDCETHADALTRQLATATEVARRNKQHYGLAVVRMEEIEAELVAANAALASVTDLLDEARSERDEHENLASRLRTELDVAEAHAEHFMAQLDETIDQRNVAYVAASTARDERDQAVYERDALAADLKRFTAAPLPATDPAVTSWTSAVAEWEAGRKHAPTEVPRLTDAEIEASDWDREAS